MALVLAKLACPWLVAHSRLGPDPEPDDEAPVVALLCRPCCIFHQELPHMLDDDDIHEPCGLFAVDFVDVIDDPADDEVSADAADPA